MILRDGEIYQLARIIGREPCRCVVHNVKVEVMHPCLIQDDVGEFGLAVLGVLDFGAADDGVALAVVRLPERGLVDPIGFLQNAFAKSKGFEHFHRAACDAVGLAEEQAAGLLLNNHGLDIVEGGELCRQRQARRATTNDQNIDRVGKRVRCCPAMLLGWLGNVRIAGSESIEMKLHLRRSHILKYTGRVHCRTSFGKKNSSDRPSAQCRIRRGL